ncbi:MAG: prepilin-type N-terminal cleavage/methylation domain-containing protein [Kiritimatiellae bacterium]|jgi:prepilin-type N-terminal cleavage/methylation domain-containing protein|nr:prepilin-type N-terminal cleavage/methylation domain-containing protein [Kiritimatiellia bacterium]
MICKPPATRGFTLLEILLVILVIGIAAAAFFPAAMNTVDNARTRSALRETIALNRYARSRAMLDQRPVAVIYMTEDHTLHALSLPPNRDLYVNEFLGDSTSSGPFPADEENGASSATPIRSKSLPDYVRIREVKGARREADSYFVVYEANGTTDSHEVELVDPQGNSYRLRVNGLTGEIDFVD